jgi:hypothetical protein
LPGLGPGSAWGCLCDGCAALHGLGDDVWVGAHCLKPARMNGTPLPRTIIPKTHTEGEGR